VRTNMTPEIFVCVASLAIDQNAGDGRCGPLNVVIKIVRICQDLMHHDGHPVKEVTNGWAECCDLEMSHSASCTMAAFSSRTRGCTDRQHSTLAHLMSRAPTEKL